MLERFTRDRTITSNAAWLLTDRILRMALGITLGVWIARYLGTEQFGQLNYAIAFLALFGAMAPLGLESIVVRELVRHPEQRETILSSTFALRLAGAILALLAAVACIRLVRPADGLQLQLVCILGTGLVFQSLDVIDLWFQSQVRSKYTVIARSSSLLLFSGLRVALILGQAAVAWFAVAISGELLVAATGLVIALYMTGSPVRRLHVSRPVIRRLLRESWPLILTGLAIMLYMRIDQVMLGGIRGDSAVGLYSAALRLSEVWYVIPTIIISTVMPSITRAHAESADLYTARLKKLFAFLARTAYLVAIPVSFLATPLITLLYGEAYRSAGTILAIHVWTSLFVFLGVGITPWIINEGLTRFSLLQALLGAAVNIVLNLLFIPAYGGNGAAIATLLSQAVAAYLSLALSHRTRPMLLLQTRALLLLG